ncbi:MAG TPA: Ig-like domain-containing protein [Allosphingosinicella sp.]|jgi:VCBS repeat-containing protein
MANIAPDVDLNGDAAGNDVSLGYDEGEPLILIAPGATVGDPDSADLDQGRLIVSFAAGGTGDDQLRIASGAFAVEESDLYYQGLLIGTVSGGTDGSTPLVVRFNSNATPAIAEALIRAIGYVNFSGAPVPGDRQVTFRLTDGDGGTSIVRTATIAVTASDTPAFAEDDNISAQENAAATGSLFADNGNGNDSDPDGVLEISAVEGSSTNVGVTFTLDSGAKLTVNKDGSYVYDPNGRFDGLAQSGSGAVNTTDSDTFTYTLAGGNTATVTVTVNGVASPGDRMRGDEGDNVIEGTPGDDIFVLDQGGTDSARGLGGHDIFYFGGAYGEGDFVDAGEGDDTLVLQGDYAGGLVLRGNILGLEAISFLAGSNTAFGASGEALNSYAIVTDDAAFRAGARARINGSALLAGENLSFDGSAETNASFLIYGGRGTDDLTGGAGNDIFFFDSGRFAAGDTVTGGQGYDGLFLRGNYSIDFGGRGFAGAVSGIENITLVSVTDSRYARGGSEFGYDITLGDGLVGQGATLTVSGALLQPYETMAVDGSGETDGNLRLFGGQADDSLTGGGGGDLLHGGLGSDELTGGGGADVFRYQSTAESGGDSVDRILDFTPGTDRIELERIDADSLEEGNQAFSWIGSNAFSGAGAGSAGELRAYESDGTWFVEGDTDGDGAADLVIALTLQGQTPLSASDFVL